VGKTWTLWGDRYVQVSFSRDWLFRLGFDMGWDRWYDFFWLQINVAGIQLHTGNAIEF
jgi:hypothetical protein